MPALPTRYAWKRRDTPGLDLEERIATRCHEPGWWLVPAVSALSIALVLLALANRDMPWLLCLPGPVYMLLAAQAPLINRYARRLRRQVSA